MVRVSFFFVMFFWVGHLTAQVSKTDALFQLLETAQQDSHRVNILNKLAGKLVRRQPDTAYFLANQAIELSRRLKLIRKEAIAFECKGIALRHQAKYAESLEAHEAGIALFMSIGDSVAVGKGNLLMGNIYRNRGNYVRALQHHLKAVRLIERYDSNPKNIAGSYVNIGNVYNNLEDYEQALIYHRKGLKMWQQTEQPSKLAEAYLNIGNTWYFQKIYDSTAVYYLKALHLFDSLNFDYGRGACYSNLGAIYLEKGDLEQAKTYTLLGRKLYEKQGDKSILSTIFSQLGTVEFKSGHPKKAIEIYEQALGMATEVGNRQTAMEINEKLSEVHSSLGQFESALHYFQAYDALEDSLFNEQAFQKIAEVEFKYDIEQKEHEIAHFKIDQQKRLAERNRLIGLLILMIFFLGIIIIAFRRIKKEQKRKSQLLVDKEELLENLKATQSQLVQSEKMATIGQLTAGIAHEINNPLNFVNGNVMALQMDFEEIQPLLKKIESLKTSTDTSKTIQEIIELSDRIEIDFLSQETQSLLAGIRRGLDRTNEIIKGLRKFSHESSGGFAPADINEGLLSTLTILQGNINDNITIHKDFGDLEPINCQIGKLNQVFLNIIYNASQAIDRQGDIFISTIQKQGQIEIRIRDTGKGMNKLTRQRIFDPFFTTKDIGTGTGLGLSISYSIIEHHKGSIEVESEIGKGSTFTIQLPMNLRAD